MTYNPEVPALTTLVDYALRSDARNPSAYTWQPLTEYLSGTVTFRKNSAMALNLVVPNPDGRYTRFFHPGTRIRVKAELESVTNAVPVFDVFIPPGGGLTLQAGPGNALSSVYAVGYLGLLEQEYVYVGESEDAFGSKTMYTHAGRELSDAIRHELDALDLDKSGYGMILKPTNPEIWISEDEEASDGFYTRKALVDYYMQFAIDESVPMFPTEYIYYECFTGTLPRFWFQKLSLVDAVVAGYGGTPGSPVRTLDYESDLLTSRSTAKVEQTTHCICRSSVDNSIWEEYESASMSRRHGRFSDLIDLPTTNRDVLAQRARSIVMLRKTPIYSLEVTVRDTPGTYHIGQIVELDNAQYGLSGNYTVAEIKFDFSPTTCHTTLVLQSGRELLSEVLES